MVQFATIAMTILVLVAPVAHTILALAKGLEKLANMTKTKADDNFLSGAIRVCSWVILMCGKATAFLAKFTAPPVQK
jgi:hypothetical protein